MEKQARSYRVLAPRQQPQQISSRMVITKALLVHSVLELDKQSEEASAKESRQEPRLLAMLYKHRWKVITEMQSIKDSPELAQLLQLTVRKSLETGSWLLLQD